MPGNFPSKFRPMEAQDPESGYASDGSCEENTPDIIFTRKHLRFLNRQLQHLEPHGMSIAFLSPSTSQANSLIDILKWALTTLPGLHQTSAFGLSGLAILDMLSKLDIPRPQLVDVIFLDTLHHFQETHSLLDRIRKNYPCVTIHIYKPDGTDSADQFSRVHGPQLWERDDQLYDWLAKVEPAQRAYRDLQVNAVLTGRRRSQGGKRGDLDVIEVDEAGLIKINPLANWSFQQVQSYITAHDVPYNELLDRGYKSIGDWHSTQPVKANEDERAGRWKGQEKTECGIHNPRSKYAQFLMAQEKKKKEEELEAAFESKLDLAA